MTCSFCEREATVSDKWPAPVCHECDSWLAGIQTDLAELEAQNPELAVKAVEVVAAYERFVRAEKS